MRGVRVSLRAAGSNESRIYETNQTNWNNETNKGLFIIDDYNFTSGVQYFWKVAVEYDFSGSKVWSNESETLSSAISGVYKVFLVLFKKL